MFAFSHIVYRLLLSSPRFSCTQQRPAAFQSFYPNGSMPWWHLLCSVQKRSVVGCLPVGTLPYLLSFPFFSVGTLHTSHAFPMFACRHISVSHVFPIFTCRHIPVFSIFACRHIPMSHVFPIFCHFVFQAHSCVSCLSQFCLEAHSCVSCLSHIS